MQTHYPHMKRKGASTQLGPIGKATHFLIIRAQTHLWGPAELVFPLSLYVRLVETEPVSTKLCLIFCIFEHCSMGCIQNLNDVKENISYIFTVWHFMECLTVWPFNTNEAPKVMQHSFLWEGFELYCYDTTHKSGYIFMIFVNIITLASKAVVPKCDEICYTIAVNVWSEPLLQIKHVALNIWICVSVPSRGVLL